MDYEIKSNRIKIFDQTRVTSYKTLFEQKLLENQSEITKEDIKKIFSDSIEDNFDLDVFNNVIDNMKDDFIDKLNKKIKAQYKKTHKFITKCVEEEKYQKESETKIIKETRLTELGTQVDLKLENMKQLLIKRIETKEKLKEYYYDKANNFLGNNNLLLSQLQAEENIVINKNDENNTPHRISLPDVVDFFAGNRAKIGKDMINETFLLYNETQLMQKQVAEDYIEIENQYIEQEKHLENFKAMKNIKERNLIKSNILF